LLTVFSLSGCGAKTAQKTDAATADGKKLFTIRVATQTQFNETTIAEDLGYFKEEGIAIEYTGVLKQGQTEYQTIVQGINDAFIGGHPSNVAQAVLGGVKVKIVAPGMVDNKDNPHVNYLVRDDSSIKTLNDIVGKKVGITAPGVCTSGYLDLSLKKNNLPDKVEWVTLPAAGQQEQALKQGLIDVATSHPPFAGVALKLGGVHSIGTSWDIVATPGAGLSVRGFSDKFINEHPDIVKGFAKALYKSHVWINSHPTEAKELIAKRLNLKAEDLTVFYYDTDPTIDPAFIEQWFKMSEDLGLWKHGDIQPTDIYTNDYAPKKI
ncbi:MAG TPA: ABC transporter substrate-binding protein, partial [Desulfosporosinus sp.]|nr:ABC transporter substrate-binding protein [Desulfosporosinus sp.]